jgi:hypothetical protein
MHTEGHRPDASYTGRERSRLRLAPRHQQAQVVLGRSGSGTSAWRISGAMLCGVPVRAGPQARVTTSLSSAS